MLDHFLADPSNERAVHDLVTLLDDTFEDVNTMVDPLLFADASPIGMARLIWDRFHEEAERRFESHPIISVRTNGQQRYLSIGNFNIRLSKVGRDDFSLTVNPTGNNQVWDSGWPTVLPGYEELTSQVHLGYVPLDAWIKPEHVVLGIYSMVPGRRQSQPHTYREIDLDAVRQTVMAQPPRAPLAFRDKPRPARVLQFKKTQDQLTIEEPSGES